MRLQYDPGDGQLSDLELGPGNPRILVGRLDECEIQTANRTVSRRHCEFTWDNGQVRLRDLGSTSGTFVNGSKITSVVLDAGDKVSCGQLAITIVGDSGGGGGGGGAVPLLDPDPPKPQKKQGGAAGFDSFFSDSPSPGPSAPADDIWALDDKHLSKRGGAETVKDKVPDILGEPQPEPEPAPAPPPPADDGEIITGYELSYFDAGVGEGRFGLGPATRTAVIGRHKDATIRVKNATVSRRHCKVEWDDSRRLKVEDLGSSAGTFLNGKRIKEGWASAGDVIVLGKLEIRVIPIQEEVRRPTSGRWTIAYQDIEGNQFRHPVGPGHPPVVLGRSQVADVRLRDGTVGRKHCKVFWDNDELQVTDLQSRNGTFVNGERVRKKVLQPGDELRCGSYPVRIEGPGSSPEDAAYAEWGEDWGDDDDMEAPGWFLLYTDDAGQILYESLGSRYRMLAIGSSADCEIHSEDRGAEPDHAEVVWDEGMLLVKDLNTEIGTYVNDTLVEEEEVLRNGDVISCGDLYIHAVRGTPGATRERTAGHRTAQADDWGTWLRAHDPNFCLVFSQPGPEGTREELTIWGDGEARVEISSGEEKSAYSATVHESTVDLVCSALLRAGFPQHPEEPVEDDEDPPEVVAFQGDEQAAVLLTRRTLSKAEEYRHTTELLRTVLVQIA